MQQLDGKRISLNVGTQHITSGEVGIVFVNQRALILRCGAYRLEMKRHFEE